MKTKEIKEITLLKNKWLEDINFIKGIKIISKFINVKKNLWLDDGKDLIFVSIKVPYDSKITIEAIRKMQKLGWTPYYSDVNGMFYPFVKDLENV